MTSVPGLGLWRDCGVCLYPDFGGLVSNGDPRHRIIIATTIFSGAVALAAVWVAVLVVGGGSGGGFGGMAVGVAPAAAVTGGGGRRSW